MFGSMWCLFDSEVVLLARFGAPLPAGAYGASER